MVSINCAAVPENLIDSELFGYVAGAFTGAEDGAEGLFRAADGGTLFLDEVGSIPLQVQYRLLRVLQEGRVRPVGSDREIEVDVRMIAATSVRLDEAVAAGSFRHDLLYRLDVIRVVLPPLRDRPEDILFLFGHFMRELSEHHGLRRPDLEDSFLDALQSYHWPGNVRQLENLTERLLLTHHGRASLTAEHFAALVAPAHEGEPDVDQFADTVPDLELELPEVVRAAVDRTEEAYLRAALERTRGRVVRTAEMAGISRRTLLRKLKRLDIDRSAYRLGRGSD
jgi:transcriptional regulator with PAS, ATPase and Fis domain